MPIFITFEGGEGSGKSTQANILVERLQKQKKWAVIFVEEPGTTLLGKQVREWLKGEGSPLVIIPKSDSQLDLFSKDNGHNQPALNQHSNSPHEELLAFLISRTQLVEEVILPNLKGKNIIVSNRFADSTVAYQGYGRGIDINLILIANKIATHGIKPDLTILLDIPTTKGLVRKFGATRNRFEKEELAFHNRVREGYQRLAESEPDRWLVLDANQPIEEISEIIWQKIRRLIKNMEASFAEQQMKAVEFPI